MNPEDLESLQTSLESLLTALPALKHHELIRQALMTIARMANEEISRLDWKILNASLLDMERAFRIFYPYRHVRKVAIFGSARMQASAPEYQVAVDFAQRIAQQGFMVLTGAGGGIMEAGNQGAGSDQSFGLNIQLPFEQGSNPYVHVDRLISFKYFFTRKLFFLKESDAIVLFPGGFGTQDEAFECLTLTQTGKSNPVPLVFLDRKEGTYWKTWSDYVTHHLMGNQLINPEDVHLFTITDDIDEACQAIAQFYRIYHSSRYLGEMFIIRLNAELPESAIAQLNQEFGDILISGKIEQESVPSYLDSEGHPPLPCLKLHFNQRDFGRLYQLIGTINCCEPVSVADATAHPERK